MIALNEFIHWFEKEVKVRWPKHDFSFTEIGDWHWRLREGFDLDTLTEAVRRHRTCDDWRVPGLKKVHEYAREIQTRSRPAWAKTNRVHRSGIPKAHTFIMCIDKDERGRGNVGWFVDILLWPFRTPWTPDDYQRVAAEQARKYSDFYGGDWEVFTHTTELEMMRCANQLRGTQPLDLNELRKRYKIPPQPR